MAVSAKQREIYAKRIQGLFGGAVRVTPSQVNEEAIHIADTMFVEIGNCHKWIAPFAAALDLIANQIEGKIPGPVRVLFGDLTFKQFVADKARAGLYEIIGAAKAAEAWEFLEELQGLWLKYTDPNRKLQLCINQARRNWRSPMEIALLGI